MKKRFFIYIAILVFFNINIAYAQPRGFGFSNTATGQTSSNSKTAIQNNKSNSSAKNSQSQEWDYSIEFKGYEKRVYSKSEEYPQTMAKKERIVISISKDPGRVRVTSPSLSFEWIVDNISSSTDSDGDKTFYFNQGKRWKVEIGQGSYFFSLFWYIKIVDKDNPNIHYLFNTMGDQGHNLFMLYGHLKNNKVIFSSINRKTDSSRQEPHAVFHGTRVGKVYHLPEDSRDDYDLFFQCNVSVYGLKGEQVTLTVYVDGPTRGKGLYAPNGRYKTSEGNVAIGGSVNGRTDSDNTRWPQYTIMLPFSDLCLPDGTHTINVRWFAQLGGKFIGDSEFQTVHFTKRGKNITNFYIDGGEATPGFYE